MPITSATVEIDASNAAVWLFTRGEETVKVVATRDESGFELRISGPGRQRATQAFETLQAMLDYEGEWQRRLVSKGFSLVSFVCERRAGEERRRAWRQDADRRAP